MGSTDCKPIKKLLRSLRDLPLNTKLNPESAGGEPAKRIRDDPERNEHSNQEDRDTRNDKEVKLGAVQGVFVCGDTHMIARRRPMCWLNPPVKMPPLHQIR